MRRRRPGSPHSTHLVGLATLALVLLTGCGGSNDAPHASATATVTATVTATPSASNSPTAGSPSASPSQAPAIELGGSAAYAETYFATPSGNIGCYLLRHEGIREVECTLKSQAFAPPPRPADCDLDWAPQFTLGRTASYGACRGDVAGTPTDTVLGYGSRAANGPITCQSATTGLTCTNAETKRGFTVSRAAYRMF